jgi:ABC-type uncharacterized transport system fused permease/ATPase subunit
MLNIQSGATGQIPNYLLLNNMNYTQEQFDRLPKWAQLEINRLKNYTQSIEKQLRQEKGEEETNTFVRVVMDKYPMAKNAQIEFHTPDEKGFVEVRVNSHGKIDIQGDSRMGKTMVIMPRASNSFYIDFI